MSEQDLKPIKGLRIDWDKINPNSYLRNIQSLKSLNELHFSNAVTFFVGENGSGKSTLLEAIAVAYGFSPEGGTLNFKDCLYNDVSELNTAVRLIKGLRPPYGFFFRAESFFNTAIQFESYRDKSKEKYYARYGGKSFHEQSHGESFFALFSNLSPGLFLIDEPEAALSPQRQLSLFIHICNMAKAGAQFIIATHSPILLCVPDAQILSFDNETIEPCTFEETSSYIVIKNFINNRESIIKHLLSDDF